MGIEEILDVVRSEFDKLKDGNKLLVTTSCRHVLKTNIILLHFLLNEKKLNGMYICVDIPQIHLDRLLTKYKINSKGLVYIDTITGLSTSERINKKNILYIDNPFDVSTLNEAISRVQNDDLKRFVILDNMATLQFYASEVKNFIEKFINGIDNANISYLLLAVDKMKHTATYDIMRPFCDHELEVKTDGLDWLSEL